MLDHLKKLDKDLDGELLFDNSSKILYATDASIYREVPLAVALVKNKSDIKKLIAFASENHISLIPRAAGTSLAGQVVGNGIVVDTSKYLSKIIEVNIKERWARVEPGVNLDELNLYLKQYNLFFAPETSTSKTCRLGGMLGNNSAGSHSIVYHSTREHILSVQTVLSDGSEVEFSDLTVEEFHKKRNGNSLESKIYNQIWDILSDKATHRKIREEYPHPSVIRRNTGYALDILSDSEVFTDQPIYNYYKNKKFNFAKLLSGSEGTLAFTTELKINLIPVLKDETALLCVHFKTVKEAIRGNVLALEFNPLAVELMDKKILDGAKANRSQDKNRFFIDGDPGAILIIEIAASDLNNIKSLSEKIISRFNSNNIGCAFPLIIGSDKAKIWNLRKAGLGVIYNFPGDKKPVSFVEDTSIPVENLEAFIDDFNIILDEMNLDSVYHAHISVGELHLRPMLNLKDKKDKAQFREIAERTAHLVKKYRGSLSGEHGDGRVRGEFIPVVLSKEINDILKEIKLLWDPKSLFNPGKIVNTRPIEESLRYEKPVIDRTIETAFDFSKEEGLLRAVEKCNGVGDCRKSHQFGGTMCPTFMATKDEFASTRGRANLLRDYLINSNKPNPLNHKELFEVLDLCLSCKACKSECPSNVDMAKLKSEFLYQYYKNNKRPIAHLLIKKLVDVNKMLSNFPKLSNFFFRNSITGKIIKNSLSFSDKRKLPKLSGITLNQWINKNFDGLNKTIQKPIKTVYLFIDEITNYNESPIGIKAILLLNKLGYIVKTISHKESGRIYISKGYLDEAQQIAVENIKAFSGLINENTPLIGIEPSTILSFRDEYPDLANAELKDKAIHLAKNVFLIDEFISNEFADSKIDEKLFHKENKTILFHGHCQQKAVGDVQSSLNFLSIPKNYQVTLIPSACCGMAGTFGYEKHHYNISKDIAELVLLPEIRKSKNTVVSAMGSSCRNQIYDLASVKALHPVEILYSAMIN